MNGQIQDLTTDIEKSEIEIIKKREEIDTGTEEFKKRLRALYIVGDDSYSSMIAGSTDFYDMLMKMELVKRVANHDNEMIDKLISLKTQFEEDKKELEGKKATLEQNKSKLEEQQKSHETQRAKLQELMNKSKEQVKKLEEQKKYYEENKAKVQKDQTSFEDELAKLYKEREAIKQKEEQERLRKEAEERARQEAERQRQHGNGILRRHLLLHRHRHQATVNSLGLCRDTTVSLRSLVRDGALTTTVWTFARMAYTAQIFVLRLPVR